MTIAPCILVVVLELLCIAWSVVHHDVTLAIVAGVAVLGTTPAVV